MSARAGKVFFAGLCAALGWSAAAQTAYTIDPGRTYQRIDHFGASDCWAAQAAGRFPDAARERIADWLFSADAATNGQPKGIGLSLWRFNVGAGSADQGAASGISDPLRRTECFLRSDGGYDWSRQAGQRWFLAAARRRGVRQFAAFCNSAPVAFTANGLANGSGRPKDGAFNLRPECYGAYADFLATVLAELGAREGVRFQTVHPFNEPEWDWDDAKQEGSPARVADIARFVRLLDARLTARKLEAKIVVTESGKTDYLLRGGTDRPGRDDQIEGLFGAASSNRVAGLPHVPPLVAGHGYWTTAPLGVLRDSRCALRDKLKTRGLGYWMTELCVMDNDAEVGGGQGRDLSMRTALYVARIIHYDLCVAQASAWSWWLGVSFGDYKDGLVYVTPNAAKTDGEVQDSRLLWALGNFSRFVRPGAVRIGVTGEGADPDDPEGLMVSAFLHAEERLLTVVLVNVSERPAPVRLAVPGLSVRKSRLYLTSDAAGATLQPQAGADPQAGYAVPARSVATWAARL